MRALIAVCVCAFLAMPAAVSAQNPDVYSSAHFALELDGTISTVRSIDGGSTKTEILEYQSGGNELPGKIPGKTVWTNLTVGRVVSGDRSWAAWRKLVEDGALQGMRKNVSLVMYDNKNREVVRWNIANAWPSRLMIQTDPITGDPMELMTLAVESAKRQ